jgi:hypothetical protein
MDNRQDAHTSSMTVIRKPNTSKVFAPFWRRLILLLSFVIFVTATCLDIWYEHCVLLNIVSVFFIVLSAMSMFTNGVWEMAYLIWGDPRTPDGKTTCCDDEECKHFTSGDDPTMPITNDSSISTRESVDFCLSPGNQYYVEIDHR